MIDGNIDILELNGSLDDYISLEGTMETVGPKGDPGFSPIANVEQTETGATITITDESGTTTADITNGAQGEAGADGYSPSASVSKSGDTATITITDKNGTTTANVTDGVDGQDGQDGYSPSASVTQTSTGATITVTDKTGTTTANIINGAKGDTGNDGYSPTAIVSKVSDTATITITDKNGTTTASITDGIDGQDGTDGQDGYSPTATVSKSGKVATITITDKNGTTTTEVRDGEDGHGSGDMLKATYDTNDNGIVDNAEKVNNHTVLTDVPANALFTDTTYTAGTNVSISSGNVISATDTTYTAGTGIDITNGVISNTQTSAEWGNITGTLADQTDLNTALSGKADSSSLSTVATSGSYADLSNKPSIPTKVSDLTNDTGFITNTVNNLTNYYTSSNTYTKTEVNNLIGQIDQFKIQVVQTLPVSDIDTHTIYLVPKTGSTGDAYNEYLYINNAWELIGSTDIDLTNYVQFTDYATSSKAGVIKVGDYATAKTDDGKLQCSTLTYADYQNRSNANYISKGTLENVITGKGLVASSSLSTVATSGSYTDLSNKPTIPDELKDLTDDSTHRVVTDTEKSTWSGKQDALVSGTNIKTINNTSLLGSGNITVSADDEISIGSTTPSGSEVLWIDPNNMPSGSGAYITNQYSVATDKGYSCSYINENVTQNSVLYTGTLKGTNSVTISNVQRYLKVFVIFYNAQICIFEIDTNALSSGSIKSGVSVMGCDGAGNENYACNVTYNLSTGEFTLDRIGWQNLSNGAWNSRNDNSGYYIYRIETHN